MHCAQTNQIFVSPEPAWSILQCPILLQKNVGWPSIALAYHYNFLVAKFSGEFGIGAS